MTGARVDSLVPRLCSPERENEGDDQNRELFAVSRQGTMATIAERTIHLLFRRLP